MGLETLRTIQATHSVAIELFAEELYAICRLPDRPNSNFMTFTDFLL